MNFIDVPELFEQDPQTEGIVRSPAELGSAIAKRLNTIGTVKATMTSPTRSKPAPKKARQKVVRRAVKKMPSRKARKAAPRRRK